jgi:hypothetical protein
MNSPEDALAQAERHIREGEARIARQIALIEKLDRDGHEHVADTARELLETFQNVLENWRADLVRIECRYRSGPSCS